MRSASGWSCWRRPGRRQTIVDVLNRQIARILDLPDVKERLQTIGFDPASSTPDAAAAHMKAETDKWTTGRARRQDQDRMSARAVSILE